jgi:hypothetical protein
LLEKCNLKVWAISNRLKGQTVSDDPIDFRHGRIVGSCFRAAAYPLP